MKSLKLDPWERGPDAYVVYVEERNNPKLRTRDAASLAIRMQGAVGRDPRGKFLRFRDEVHYLEFLLKLT
jgi:hypothetical protein